MHLDDLQPDAVVRGILADGVIVVVSVAWRSSRLSRAT
jgi:hypothetical protein